MDVVNIAAYKFVGIPEPAAWRDPVKERCDQLGLKGTILFATEGINLCLAGSSESIKAFLDYLHHDQLFGDRFADLDIKESLSKTQPFGMMLIRIEKEIITMRQPAINPSASRSVVDAQTLKAWIDRGCDDEGHELVLLDARNSYETEIGTFAGAIDLGIENFSDFPAAVDATMRDAPDLMKDKTIVSFCTGGIRCEKAALYLQAKGMARVFQLDGGILRYFEQVGGAHWQGECFVFDDRRAVKTDLSETDSPI